MDEPPNSKSGLRWPRFSLSAVFYLVFCLAVSLTSAAAPAAEENEIATLFGVSIYTPQVAWHYALLSLATLGTATALVQQGNALASFPGFGITRGVRYGHAAALLGLLAARVLMQRGVFAWPERKEIFYVGVEIFPDAMLLMLLLFGARVVFGQRKSSTRSESRIAGWLALIAGCVLVCIVVTEPAIVSWLVYIACAGIEHNQPLPLRRLGAYPYHSDGGSLTYQTSLAAVVVLSATTIAAAAASSVKHLWVRRLLLSAVAAGFVAVTLFDWWYYTREFPRVWPDAASVGFAAITADWIVGAGLLAMLTLWLACENVKRQGEAISTSLNGTGRLGQTPHLLTALGLVCLGGLDATDTVLITTSYSGLWFPTSAWDTALEVLHVFFKTPGGLLSIAVLVQGLWACYALWRGGQPVAYALPLRPVARTWLAFLLLGLIGAPALAAWGFASWLGPWWL